MTKQQYVTVTAVLFALVTLFHLARLFSSWSVVIGNWDIPIWVSVIGAVVAGYLAYQGYQLKGKK